MIFIGGSLVMKSPSVGFHQFRVCMIGLKNVGHTKSATINSNRTGSVSGDHGQSLCPNIVCFHT